MGRPSARGAPAEGSLLEFPRHVERVRGREGGEEPPRPARWSRSTPGRGPSGGPRVTAGEGRREPGKSTNGSGMGRTSLSHKPSADLRPWMVAPGWSAGYGGEHRRSLQPEQPGVRSIRTTSGELTDDGSRSRATAGARAQRRRRRPPRGLPDCSADRLRRDPHLPGANRLPPTRRARVAHPPTCSGAGCSCWSRS